jgi:hypothetical protein
LTDLSIKGTYYGSGVALSEEDLSFLEKILITEVIYGEKTTEGILVITKEKLLDKFDGFFPIKKKFNTDKVK